MSSWIVSRNHIAVLVEACYRYEVIKEPLTPDELGQLLWRENHKSVNCCYGERSRTPRYTHNFRAVCSYHDSKLGTARELVRDPHLLFKVITCYKYQSCDHTDWARSLAHGIVGRLKQAVCAGVGLTSDEMHTCPQWKGGPWGID